MSAMKLSSTLSITLKEAEALIEDYFKAFPKIKVLLDWLGNFGVQNGYSRTMAPFFRKRFYSAWGFVTDYIEAHVKGIEYHPVLGTIDRASRNHPIQGSAADQIKLATVLIRWYIRDNNLGHLVKLLGQVHDENITACREDFAEEWKPIMTSLMEIAAKISMPSGLLKADTSILDRWGK